MRSVVLVISFILLYNTAYSRPDSLLLELEKTLQHKQYYTDQRLKKINVLKNSLALTKKRGLNAYDKYLQIFQEYKTLNFDSALTYAVLVKTEAIKLKDIRKITNAEVNTAFILLSSGMFKETHEVVEKIPISVLSNEEKIDFYILKARYFYDLCGFVKNDSYCSTYANLGNKLIDSAIALSPKKSYSYYFASGLKKLRTGDFDQAIADYSQIIAYPNITLHQYAIIASTLSFLYQQKKQPEKAFELLIKAAIADLKSATKENVAMFELANILFRSGENAKAHQYIKEAMADAEFYGARHRQFEVGTLLPIIEGKQLMLVEKQKTMFLTYAAVLTLLILIIFFFITIVITQNKKLKAAQKSISEANKTLQLTNNALTEVNNAIREANRIKDEYIGYYFNINSEYIDKIERFKKSVLQRLSLSRYDEIKQIVNKIDLKKEREELSQSFDKVFIKLFPNFVTEFDKLFAEADRIKLPEEQILSTELRIFALIRLGIHDNDRIAKILGFSVNTIYAYKTRIKNKSYIPNDEFENRVLAIKAD